MFRRIRRRRATNSPSPISSRDWSACAVVVALVAAAGCGEIKRDVAHLQGVLTIGGEPLPANTLANISFRPTIPGQGRAAGAKIVDGTYDCRDAPLGKVKVYVGVQQPTGKMIRESDGVPFREVRSIISPKYGAGIDLEITGDNDQQNFDLESSSGLN